MLKHISSTDENSIIFRDNHMCTPMTILCKYLLYMFLIRLFTDILLDEVFIIPDTFIVVILK